LELFTSTDKSGFKRILSSDIASTVSTAVNGADIALAHIEGEPEPVNINLRLPASKRNLKDVSSIKMAARNGQLLAIGSMTNLKSSRLVCLYIIKIFKNCYVIAEVAGKSESPVYAILGLRSKIDKLSQKTGIPMKKFLRAS
jgi:Cu/Ag efflux pump CusA